MTACNGSIDITGFVVGAVADDDRHTIEAHLETCERCSARLGKLRVLERMIAAAPIGPEPPRELEEHVFALVDKDPVAMAVGRAALSPEPPAYLESRTFTRVNEEIAHGHRSEGANVTRPRRWQRASIVLAPAFAAAAVVLAILLLDARGVVDLPIPGLRPKGHEVQRVALSGPGGTTHATLEHYAHDNFRIELDTEGVPLHRDGVHYEVWLAGDAGELAVGSFRYLRPFTARNFIVTFNVGVDPKDYPEMMLTREPNDGDPARSDDVMMRGRIDARSLQPYGD